ncbi:uncharacterized protein EAE97_011627 [Botrytis byssoidea]|uniref:Uncharacterized protein n=1 Tax=Botrytis byssoidea TaxID=139641 RepID=A0A9P5LQB6_9HELO|nr:uncharacterized protein EAE97_011627 [Botrytis byssoidea]KAF7919709.1 hypothetical protein EAE97_011627 [Botrytis byssoidea]
MTQVPKSSMQDSKEDFARHHQHHHQHYHASTTTSASVVNFASAINFDLTTKGLTTKSVQSSTSKNYDHLHHENIDRLTCEKKLNSDAQHHYDHNTSISTIASTTSSTVRGINLPWASQKKKLFVCLHHDWGQKKSEHHHYDNAFATAYTSASTTSKSTIRREQSSTPEEVIPGLGLQDEQLAGVGSWMEEYDDSCDGNHPEFKRHRGAKEKGKGWLGNEVE